MGKGVLDFDPDQSWAVQYRLVGLVDRDVLDIRRAKV